MIAKVNGKDGQVSGACQVCVHEISRVVRNVDTTNLSTHRRQHPLEM